MKHKIGLTGLIGSGKSLVAEYFRRLGVDIIDTDAISHTLTSSGGIAMPYILEVFGEMYITADGALHRPLMRELIFSNVIEKHKLESILHPLIFEEVVVRASQTKSIYSVIVVPLLFQAPLFHRYVDRSIFVDCRESIIVDRVIKRNGWSREMVLEVLHNQMPRAKQLKLADDVLDNNKTLHDLELQVKNLHEKYTLWKN